MNIIGVSTMRFKPLAFITAAATMAAMLCSVPAIATIKDGVDAWSRGDYEGAVKQWREPALQGDADAQFNLGQAYKMGRGVKADLNVALDWYKRAAAQGHLQAADSYGHLLHYQGKIAESLPYLRASADRGEARSQYLLGTELFNGTNAPKDWVRAYALMTRASSAGMGPASRSLAQMDQYIPLEQRQQGTVLAGQLEQRAGENRNAQIAGFPINTAPPVPVGRPISVPPSAPSISTRPGFPTSIPTGPIDNNPAQAVPMPMPKPPTPKPAIAAVRPAQPAPRTIQTNAKGAWRVQLGAFGNEANARSLWTNLERRISDLSSLQPYLKSAGSITRLQAGPFATRTAAEAMCVKVKAAGQACLAVDK
jgi:uncharacterized protein